ncbi:MAG: MmgE/PrpD family protein [Acidobacteria bacterium]|nr:MmgE/PrpD family protein [Acidobacteriota bacterium]
MKPNPILRRDFLKASGIGAWALSMPEWSFPIVRAETGTSEDKIVASKSTSRTTVLQDIAAWVVKMRYEELPPPVVKAAKLVLLDTLGCALGAIDAAPVRMAQQVVSMQGGNPQATAVGIGRKATCDQAVFLNGMALRYLDYNDYAAKGSPHHPSINVAPALAIAEMQGLTGKDLLLGITVGYEVQLRLRDATDGASRRTGWDYGSITTQYSSAASSAKLLGLDASKITNALAIAGANANTLFEVRGGGASGDEMTPAKGAADPMGARNGTFAALLARAGLNYPPTILEGVNGYGKIVTGILREDVLRERTGDYRILYSCKKMWPCMGLAQAPIAAALEIYQRKIVPDDIESIKVALNDFGYKNQQAFLGEINTREHADHSVAYTVSRALLDGNVTVEDFEEKRFKDPRALRLVKKVSLRSDPSLTEAHGAKLEVQFRNGNVLKAEVPYPPGSLQNPPDDEALVKKFVTLAENVLGKARAHKATEIILAADTMPNLIDLVNAVSPLSKGGRR